MKYATQIHLLLAGCAMLAALPAAASPQTAVEPPCDEVSLPWEQIPSTTLGWLDVTADQMLVFYDPGNPVTGVRIGGPKFLDPAESVVCGTDYVVRLVGGAALVTFSRPLPYYIEVDLATDTTLAGFVNVDSQTLGPAQEGKAKDKEVTVPEGDAVLVGKGVKDDNIAAFPEWNDSERVCDTASAATAICKAYEDNGNKPVDVVIVSHGSSAEVMLGGVYAAGALDSDNVCEFAEEIKEKVEGKWIVLVSCRIGAGDSGKEFVCKLAETSCTKVSSATGSVTLGRTGKLFIQDKPLMEKDARPDGGDENQSEGSGNGAPPAYERVLLPLDTFSSDTPAFFRLLSCWGSSDVRWDLNRNGEVEVVDLFLLWDALAY